MSHPHLCKRWAKRPAPRFLERFVCRRLSRLHTNLSFSPGVGESLQVETFFLSASPQAQPENGPKVSTCKGEDARVCPDFAKSGMTENLAF